MKSSKVFLVLIVSILLFFIFSTIEFEPLNQATNKYFQSLIFTLTFAFTVLKPKFRIKVFFFAFFLLFLMVGLYLLQRLTLANSLSSIGIGILFITSLTYLPELIKTGYIEKL